MWAEKHWVLKLKQKRLSGLCHLNFKISCLIVSQVWIQKILCNWSRYNSKLVSYHEKNSMSFQINCKTPNNNKKIAERKSDSWSDPCVTNLYINSASAQPKNLLCERYFSNIYGRLPFRNIHHSCSREKPNFKNNSEFWKIIFKKGAFVWQHDGCLFPYFLVFYVLVIFITYFSFIILQSLYKCDYSIIILKVHTFTCTVHLYTLLILINLHTWWYFLTLLAMPTFHFPLPGTGDEKM